MKLYKSKFANKSYLIYRIINQVIDPIIFFSGLYRYIYFIRDIFVFSSKSKRDKISIGNLFPMLHDRGNFTTFDAHYFFQQLWVFEHVLKNMPLQHVDVGSTYQLSGYLSKIVKTTFVDIRPIDTKLKNLEIRRDNIVSLGFEKSSIESLSCLHVIEHIGLGRYGDEIDPYGIDKACSELSRVLKIGGFLYLSTPMGKDRLCFNAHRVSSVERILSYFKDLDLVSFSYVDDNGVFHDNYDVKNHKDGVYECGMFKFTKKS